MKKIPKQEYTAEFKGQAVKRAQAVGSDGVLCEGCAVKYAWIDAQRREYPLPDMCEVLAVSISGYRAWRRGGKPDRMRPKLEASRARRLATRQLFAVPHAGPRTHPFEAAEASGPRSVGGIVETQVAIGDDRDGGQSRVRVNRKSRLQIV